MAETTPSEADIIAIMGELQASIPKLDNTLGAILVATCIATMLSGLTAHQTYRFVRLYPDDGWKLKVFVAVIFALDVTHTVLCIHTCYFYLVLNYFDPPRLLFGVWSIRILVILTGVVIFISHMFYTRRMFLVGGRRVWPVLFISSAIFTEFGLCIASTVEAFTNTTFKTYTHFAWLICSALGTAVMVDIFITVSLIFYLRRSRTGFKRTDSIVDILMVYAINTGLSTSIISLSACVTAITMPDNLIYTGLYLVASKMYANSVLAVLNSRRSLVDKGIAGFETGSFGMKADEPRDRSLSFTTDPSSTRNADVPLEDLDGKDSTVDLERGSERKSTYGFGGYGDLNSPRWAVDCDTKAEVDAEDASAQVPVAVPVAQVPDMVHLPLQPLRYQGQ